MNRMYLTPGVDVRLELADVADLQLGAGLRHHLHDADGADLRCLRLWSSPDSW